MQTLRRGPSSRQVKQKVLVQGLDNTVDIDQVQQPIHHKTHGFKRFGSLNPPSNDSLIQANTNQQQQAYINQKTVGYQIDGRKQILLEQQKQFHNNVSQYGSGSQLNQSHYITNSYNKHIKNSNDNILNSNNNSNSNNNQITNPINNMKPIFVNNDFQSSSRMNLQSIQSPMDERISQHQIFSKPQNSMRNQSPSQRNQFIFNSNIEPKYGSNNNQQQQQPQQKKGIFMNQFNGSVRNMEQMKTNNTDRKSVNPFDGVNNKHIQDYIDQQIIQRSQYIYEQIGQQINRVENGSQQFSSNQMQQFINTYEQDLDKIKQSFQQVLDCQNQQKRMIEQNQKDIQILRSEQLKLNQKVDSLGDSSKMMSQSRVQGISVQHQNDITQLNKKLDYEIQLLKDSQKLQLENKKIQEQSIRDQQKQIQSIEQQLNGFIHHVTGKESQITGKCVGLEDQIKQLKQQQSDQMAKIQQNLHLQRQANTVPSNNFQQMFNNKQQIQPDRQSIYQQYHSMQKSQVSQLNQ